MLTWLFVAARIVANPVSNVFQKQLAQRSAGPVFIIAATHGLLTLACIPLVLIVPPELPDTWAFWSNIVISGALAVAGNALLVAALRTGDLSVLGPINAYKSVLSLILGIFLVHEIPSLMGLLGVLLILAGSYFVMDRSAGESRRGTLTRFLGERGVQLRFAALLCSATEAVFLKRALLASSPLTTFIVWCVLGLLIAALAVGVLTRSSLRNELHIARENGATYLWLALTTGVMQFTTLFTFGQLQVGYSLALFQLSTLISVFLGYRYFQEQNLRKRLIGSLIMVAGAVLIVVLGKSK